MQWKLHVRPYTEHPLGKARCTVLSSWTCSAAESWAGRSTTPPPRDWSPPRWEWQSGTASPTLEPSQFTSWAFTQRALESGLVPSMGTVGDCFDNATMESFWARMQVELLDRRRWRTRIALANAIFEYLEIFHNRQRRHTALDMRTPIEYETNHNNNRTVTPLIQVS